MNALIIVDLQNDFLPGGALPVPRGDEVISLANELQQRFELVLATQDWHPPNHRSFAANHPGKKPGDRIKLDGIEQILWPVHCVQIRTALNSLRHSTQAESLTCFTRESIRVSTATARFLTMRIVGKRDSPTI